MKWLREIARSFQSAMKGLRGLERIFKLP